MDDVYTSSYSEIWVNGKYEKRKDVEITLKGGGVKKFVVDDSGKVRLGDFVGERLDNVIGKEMAEKILSAQEDTNFGKQDLKVGGKGMKGFYGSMEEGSKGIVGSVAEKLFRQKLGKTKLKGVGKAEIEGVEIFGTEGRSEYDKYRGQSTQPSIDVTPELRAEVERGLALFQRQQGQQAKGAMVAADGAFIIYALTDPNVSTPLHETAHVFEHYLTNEEKQTVQEWA